MQAFLFHDKIILWMVGYFFDAKMALSIAVIKDKFPQMLD